MVSEYSLNELIRMAVNCVVETDELCSSDFETRIGENKETVSHLLQSWSDLDIYSDESSDLINSCLNEVCHGLFFDQEEWEDLFPVSKEQLRELFSKWKNEKSEQKEHE